MLAHKPPSTIYFGSAREDTIGIKIIFGDITQSLAALLVRRGGGGFSNGNIITQYYNPDAESAYIDIIQRTKHTRCNTNNSGSGIISLSTSQPKNNITVAPSSSISMLNNSIDTNNGMYGNINNDGGVDDMEFSTNNNQSINQLR